MASNILNVLENVEKGRQNCIKNAKLANLPATDNMDIFNIGNLFLEQNNTEFIDPNATWVRPSDWWDTKSILENAQDIEQDGVIYHPAYIMLLSNGDISTTMSKTASSNASQGDAYIFSDEPNILYVGDQTHTWNVSKDKPCSLGYKTRYVIIYMIDTIITANINIGSGCKCLEIICDKLNIKQNNREILCNNNNYIINFETTANTQYDNPHSSSSCFYNCGALCHIKLPSITHISANGFCQTCNSLIDIELPNCTSISGSYSFSGCKALKKINLPALVSSSAYGLCQYCASLLEINFPNVTELIGSAMFESCYSLRTINLPKLTKLSQGIINCNSLTNINLPAIDNGAGLSGLNSLKNLTLNIKSITGNLLSSCYGLTDLNLPYVTNINGEICNGNYSLLKFEFPNTLQSLRPVQFNKCTNLTTINLITNWRWSLNVKDTNLSHECIIDMFNKLKDLTGADSLTLTIGANNLAKVTNEELQIPNSKNWTVQ